MSVTASVVAATSSGYPARHLVHDEPEAQGSETTQRRPELAERLPVAHVGLRPPPAAPLGNGTSRAPVTG
jgi:hypothetical protein